MSRSIAGILGLVVLTVTSATAESQETPKGYWQFVESFIDPYPPVEKRNKAGLYELKWAPRQLTTRVGSLVGPGGSIMKEPVTERTDRWTWTALPAILVPAEKLSVRLEYTVVSVRGEAPESGFSAGFVLAAPRDKEIYLVNNATSKFYGNVVTDPNGLRVLSNYRDPKTLDGTIVVPGLGYAESGNTKLIDFAVVIAPGGSFTTSVNYRYKWNDGVPPPIDQRGGPISDPSEAADGVPTSPVPTDGADVTTPASPTDGDAATPAPPASIPEPASTTKFTVQAGVRRVKPGEVVQVPIYLLNPQGLSNTNVTVNYTPIVVASERQPIRGNVLGTALFEANSAEPGIARLGLAASKPLADSGILAHLSFKAVGKPGDRTALKVVVTTANTIDGKPMPAETIDGEVLIVGEGGKIPGDHDGDGVITAGDALSALKMSVRLIDEDLSLDMDQDGRVTSNDARLILLKVIGK